ncbi:hypothetical protein AAF712_009587 [Marasmius tenuissimus]|uniref:Uncharacterized protein n=1 Tax=Marasmius tenuissimus TaxID=585030 RepID=A0ABR2ZQ54_9AGAR
MLRYTVISNAAMKTNAWGGSDGIITEGASRNENNDGVGFKGLLYNALLDLAANGTTYSAAWKGPPQGFTSWGQLAALDVLVSAIDAN